MFEYLKNLYRNVRNFFAKHIGQAVAAIDKKFRAAKKNPSFKNKAIAYLSAAGYILGCALFGYFVGFTTGLVFTLIFGAFVGELLALVVSIAFIIDTFETAKFYTFAVVVADDLADVVEAAVA